VTRIATALERARGEGRAALIAYLCAGDPDLATTTAALPALAEAGADVIELGVPFSDPTADGPVIQRASERALRGGTTFERVLDVVREVRTKTEVPIVLFGYYNPLHARGHASVAAAAHGAGADGFLVVDLPPEECAPLRDQIVARGMDWIPLVAPTSTDARIALAASVATSFVYVVSVAGVTGAGGVALEAAARRAAEIRERTSRPVALGFGIKSAADVERVRDQVDAVVVGSAIVTALESGPERAASLVRDLRAATAQRH
jgi:tryptophan synthase alpha chain